MKYSTAYHPQTDGQTEVVNRSLETYLRCFVGPKPKQWVDWLSWAEFWFNTTFNISTGMTPFKALYGRDPPTLIKGCTFTSKIDAVNQLLVARDVVLQELKQNLLKAQNLMKAQANKHKRQIDFEVGDWVFLKLQPYKRRSLARRPVAKLSPKFYGPYKILERIGPVAYKLELPAHAKIHPVFHVSLLKKSLKSLQHPQPLPPVLSEEMELQVQPAEILQWREDALGKLEVLVQWDQLPACENSWESATQILEVFPQFPLEDKVVLLGGSIDRVKRMPKPLITKVYVRRQAGSNRNN